MNSWTPLWSQVVDSSLWEEKPSVRILFLTMLALKDADHVVRYDAYKLHKKANLTPDETMEALEVLKSPDKRKAAFEQEFEGRRIEEVPGGWLVLNGEKYRSMIAKLRNREYKTQWERDKRSKEKRVVLEGKDAEAFEAASDKSRRWRRKAAEDAGVKNGARQAIKEGLEQAGPKPDNSSAPQALTGSGLKVTRAFE